MEHVAMAKVRARIRREIELVEEEEHASGELNLVPYLDIVTNVVIFLLATTLNVIALANINVTAPRFADPSTVTSSASDDKPDKSLNLTVTISYGGHIIAGSGAVLPGPDGNPPTIRCKEALKNGRCPGQLAMQTNERGEAEPIWRDGYDYAALKRRVEEIKKQYPRERKVIVMADRAIPYQIVVKVMDVLRGTPTSKCTGKDGCLFDQVILSAGVQ